MKRLRDLAAPVLLAAAGLLLCASTTAPPKEGQVVWVTGPTQLSPAVLNCPFLIDFRWIPVLSPRKCPGSDQVCEPREDFFAVRRGPPGGEMEVVGGSHSQDRNDWFRDEDVAPDQEWRYDVIIDYECPNPLHNCYGAHPLGDETVTVGEACSGLLFEDLDFPGGTHYLDWIQVHEDAVLTIGGGTFLPYEDETAGFTCCSYWSSLSDCSKEEAQIRIDGGEFISVNVALTGGGGEQRQLPRSERQRRAQ
jgi:hypothetical protein